MKSILLFPAVCLSFAIVMMTPSPVRGDICLDQTGCVDCCPACGYHCQFDAECKDSEIDGFDVESKVICIPRVVFPWQKRDACGCMRPSCNKCLNNGARLRRVCVLKPDSRKCKKCNYSWEAKKRECAMVAIQGITHHQTVLSNPNTPAKLEDPILPTKLIESDSAISSYYPPVYDGSTPVVATDADKTVHSMSLK